jgi:Arc/MetJ-type ribon-helix-helix transcriptional regulator
MKNKPRAYVTALPLSALPDLQDLLAPFFAAKGQPRDHVVMVRLGDEAVERLDELVEAGFSSRSEAAAFLIGAGIQAQSEFFARITRQASEIKRLRDELLQTAREALSASSPQPAPAKPRKTRARGASDPES